MFRLAIIGAGQLGSRHLQGLVRSALPCEIDIVDPSTESLSIARQRFDEVSEIGNVRAVRYHTAMSDLPRELDYVVIATAADVRLRVIESLLQISAVRLMLLEKVLFQRLDEYASAHKLINEKKVKTWVNCTRRAFPIYSEIQAFFASERLRHFQVTGGGWGLGCNSIHFIDLLGMLTSATPTEISAAGLDKVLIPSKRKNFMEFTGTLRGNYAGDTEFDITSMAESSARLLLTLRSDHRTCIVDETAGQAFFQDVQNGGSWEHREFKIPFLSDLAGTLTAQILTQEICPLPTFEQSLAYHLPLLQSLSAHAAACYGTAPGYCPIT